MLLAHQQFIRNDNGKHIEAADQRDQHNALNVIVLMNCDLCVTFLLYDIKTRTDHLPSVCVYLLAVLVFMGHNLTPIWNSA